jgi:hypothetical protein
MGGEAPARAAHSAEVRVLRSNEFDVSMRAVQEEATTLGRGPADR